MPRRVTNRPITSATDCKNSDVDLVVCDKIPHDTLAQLKFQLEEETPLPYHFDIILWDEIENDKLREHILQHGREFYKNLRGAPKN